MIKALLFFALFTVALASHIKWPPQGMEECKKTTGATDIETTLLTHNKIPRSELEQCFYGCVWQKMDLLKDDMTIDPAVFIDYIKYILKNGSPKFTPEITLKAMALYSTCSLEVNQEPVSVDEPKASCLVAKKFGECAEKISKKLQFGEYAK